MTYGKRLGEAMARRGAALGREITRIEVANAAGCSRQNLGMILTNAKSGDHKLSTDSHAKVSEYLKVDPNWLLNGQEVGVVVSSKVAPLTLLKKLTAALDSGRLSESQVSIISDLLDEFVRSQQKSVQSTHHP